MGEITGNNIWQIFIKTTGFMYQIHNFHLENTKQDPIVNNVKQQVGFKKPIL